MGLDVVPLRRAQTETSVLRRSACAAKPMPLLPPFERPERTCSDIDFDIDDMDMELPAPSSPSLTRQRSNSVPASFHFDGPSANENEVDATGLRPRSFDSWGPASPAKRASLCVLDARIQEEEMAVHSRQALVRDKRRHSGSEMILSMAKFFSPAKKEASHLRRMQMVTEAAKSRRSLTILNDIRTLVLMTEDSEFAQTPRASLVDAAIQRLMDGAVSADDVLSEDSMHHVLALQADWLKCSVEYHQQKDGHHRHHRARSASCMALQSFLNSLDGKRVPAAMDQPTATLMEFEQLITRHRLVKPKVKRAFDAICSDTMATFTESNPAALEPHMAQIWEAREPSEVLWCIIDEIVGSILEEAWVASKYRPTLQLLVEQMVFSRLAAVCYRDKAFELDEQNTQWREQVVEARKLRLEDLGLGVDSEAAFPKSIAAFNRLPYLVPSSVVSSFLDAIRVLYKEAAQVLHRSAESISADVILPLLVLVLSRCHLPHLHSQILLMEQFASKTKMTQEGSEAAYYLATLQAAVGYIMNLSN